VFFRFVLLAFFIGLGVNALANYMSVSIFIRENVIVAINITIPTLLVVFHITLYKAWSHLRRFFEGDRILAIKKRQRSVKATRGLRYANIISLILYPLVVVIFFLIQGNVEYYILAFTFGSLFILVTLAGIVIMIKGYLLLGLSLKD
jgi:hypothetical protein